MTGALFPPGGTVCIPDELREHEPSQTRRSMARPLGYGAVTAAVVFAFLLQILNGVCPVP